MSCDALMRVYGSDPQSLNRFLLHDETAMSFGLTLVVCETMHAGFNMSMGIHDSAFMVSLSVTSLHSFKKV